MLVRNAFFITLVRLFQNGILVSLSVSPSFLGRRLHVLVFVLINGVQLLLLFSSDEKSNVATCLIFTLQRYSENAISY